MNQPVRKLNLDITVHKDNTVSYWCIYTKTWRRTPIENISLETMLSLNQEERERIQRKQYD